MILQGHPVTKFPCMCGRILFIVQCPEAEDTSEASLLCGACEREWMIVDTEADDE